jgi:single-stranded-DNA-specific exonuclease
LAALGTIADMMKREQDNVKIIQEGLEALEESWRPGILALFKLPEFARFPNIESKVQKMISILNVRDVEEGYPASFRILSNASEEKVARIAEKLLEIYAVRKQRTQALLEKVRMDIAKKQEESIVFEGGEDFDYILLGIVASVISQETEKPTFIYKKQATEAVGSVRAPSGYDTVEAMKHCGKYTITYGGHPQASGFRVKNTNLPKFKSCLIEYFEKQHG